MNIFMEDNDVASGVNQIFVEPLKVKTDSDEDSGDENQGRIWALWQANNFMQKLKINFWMMIEVVDMPQGISLKDVSCSCMQIVPWPDISPILTSPVRGPSTLTTPVSINITPHN